MQVRFRKNVKLNIRELIYVLRKGNPIQHTVIKAVCGVKNCIQPMHLKLEEGKRSGRYAAKQIATSVEALQKSSWLKWHYKEPEVVNVALQIRDYNKSKHHVSENLRRQVAGNGYGKKYVSPIMDFEDMIACQMPQRSKLLSQKGVRQKIEEQKRQLEQQKLAPPPKSLLSTMIEMYESRPQVDPSCLYSGGESAESSTSCIKTRTEVIPGTEEEHHRRMFHMSKMMNGGGEVVLDEPSPEEAQATATDEPSPQAQRPQTKLERIQEKINEIIIKYIRPPKSQKKIKQEQRDSNREKHWNEMMAITPVDQSKLAPWIKQRSHGSLEIPGTGDIVRVVMPLNKFRKVSVVELDEVINVIRGRQITTMKTAMTDIRQSGNVLLMLIMKKEMPRPVIKMITPESEGGTAQEMTMEVEEEDARQLMRLLKEAEEAEA
jgi:hypothetical protein